MVFRKHLSLSSWLKNDFLITVQTLKSIVNQINNHNFANDICYTIIKAFIICEIFSTKRYVYIVCLNFLLVFILSKQWYSQLCTLSAVNFPWTVPINELLYDKMTHIYLHVKKKIKYMGNWLKLYNLYLFKTFILRFLDFLLF